MRRVRLDDALAAIPTGGYVEICQDEHNADSSNDQYAPVSLLATAAQIDAIQLGGRSAIVATTGGATTGLIPADALFAEVTTDSIDKQISLPAAVAGKSLYIFVNATGCELISVVAGDKVNNVVVGATNEAALVALTLYSLVYDGVDNWVMTGLTQLGAVETPVVPNAL